VGGGGALVALTLELEQYSPALGLPMAAVYLALPVSGLIMTISALAALVDGAT
jgi:TRAP-type C4-dicarboxylate transport system permease small subunit